VHVDDRHGKQRAAYRQQRLALQQSANDLDAIEFVTVYRGRDEQRRAMTTPADHVHGHRQ
jgi:hypothetical protein